MQCCCWKGHDVYVEVKPNHFNSLSGWWWRKGLESRQVFFSWEDGGPQVANICPSLLFDNSLFLPNWVLSQKISKILPHFSLNFDYFLAQTWNRKLFLMLKTPKFALSWPQQTIFSSPLSSDSLPDAISPPPTRFPPPDAIPPPIWLRPRRDRKSSPKASPPPPPKILWKNPGSWWGWKF